MAAMALFLSIKSAQSRLNGCATHIPEESVPQLQEAEQLKLSPSTACSAAATLWLATDNQDSIAKSPNNGLLVIFLLI